MSLFDAAAHVEDRCACLCYGLWLMSGAQVWRVRHVFVWRVPVEGPRAVWYVWLMSLSDTGAQVAREVCLCLTREGRGWPQILDFLLLTHTHTHTHTDRLQFERNPRHMEGLGRWKYHGALERVRWRWCPSLASRSCLDRAICASVARSHLQFNNNNNNVLQNGRSQTDTKDNQNQLRDSIVQQNTKNQGANYKKILRLSYDVIITYDNRKSNLR